jgi:hypothetical protein
MDDIKLLRKIEELFTSFEILKLRMGQERAKAKARAASTSLMEIEELIGPPLLRRDSKGFFYNPNQK